MTTRYRLELLLPPPRYCGSMKTAHRYSMAQCSGWTTQVSSQPQISRFRYVRYSENGTSVIETIDVLTDDNGEYIVGQFLFPEDIDVGPNSTYEVYSEVTEMFVHDYSSTLSDTDGDGIGDSGTPVEVRANTTIGFVSGERFRSDEQPLSFGLQGPLLGRLQQGDFRQQTSLCAGILHH